jgi:hypothetical protein
LLTASLYVEYRVSDPYSFDTDPDPAFRLNTDPGDQKSKKLTAEKILIFFINYNLSIPRTPQRMSKLKKKPSGLKGEDPALQNIKFQNFFYFCGSFLPSWIRIPNTDPDPGPLT